MLLDRDYLLLILCPLLVMLSRNGWAHATQQSPSLTPSFASLSLVLPAVSVTVGKAHRVLTPHNFYNG